MATASPYTLSTKVSKVRESKPISKEAPLVPQLKSIYDKLKDNQIVGDIEDTFYTLLGEVEFKGIVETLVRYTGLSLEDLDNDVKTFGDQLLNELQSTDVGGAEGLLRLVKSFYDQNP